MRCSFVRARSRASLRHGDIASAFVLALWQLAGDVVAPERRQGVEDEEHASAKRRTCSS